MIKIINGDSLDVLSQGTTESIDVCITDCPYKIVAGGVSIKEGDNECSGILNKRTIVSDGTDCNNKWLKKNADDIPSAVKAGKMFKHNDITFKDWLPDLYRVMKQGTHTYIMINGRNLAELQNEAEICANTEEEKEKLRNGKRVKKKGFIYQNLLIWQKGNCLGGSTQLLLKNNKGIIYRGNLKDLYRNFSEGTMILAEDGKSWVKIKQVFKNSEEKVDVLNIITRGGSIIKPTGEHIFYINGKEVLAKDLKKGDILDMNHFKLPSKNSFYDYDIGEIIGLYLADGSRDGTHGYRFNLNNTTKDKYFEKIIRLCDKFDCSYNIFEEDCKKIITVSGILGDIISKFISGNYSYTKKLNKDCYNQGFNFLRGLFDGYIGGDGHVEETSENNFRIRIGMTYNKELENDLRILSNLLGYQFKSKNYTAKIGEKEYPSIRITITSYTNHHNQKLDTEILNIKTHKSNIYDIEVESDSHKYCLANGVITHNCTPNKYYMQGAEFILMLRKGPARSINNMGSKNIISIPNIIGNKIHPTEKPVELYEYLLRNSLNGKFNKETGQVENIGKTLVIDPFAGSGPIIEAGHNLNCDVVAIEIDKAYADICNDRATKLTTNN